MKLKKNIKKTIQYKDVWREPITAEPITFCGLHGLMIYFLFVVRDDDGNYDVDDLLNCYSCHSTVCHTIAIAAISIALVSVCYPYYDNC